MIYLRKFIAFAILFGSVVSQTACKAVEDDPYHHEGINPDDFFQDLQEKVGG